MAGTRCAWSISLILMPGVLARSVTAAVGRPPTQKKASILRSLSAEADSATPSRSRRMSRSLSGPAAPLTPDAPPLGPLVATLVEPRGLDDAEGHDLGGAAARAGRYALALEVLDLADVRAVEGHHVHAVRIQDHQRAHRDRLALELVLTLQRVERGVGHREGDVGLAGADELQVGDRAAGHFGGGLHAVDVLGKHRGHATAERAVHAAGSAGGDGQVLRLRRPRDRHGQQRNTASQKLHGFLLWFDLDITARPDRNASRQAGATPA